MRKIVGVLAISGASLLLVTLGARAQVMPNGQPFQALWDAISDLTDLLTDEIARLDQRVDDAGVPVGTIVMWSGALDGNGAPLVGGTTSDTNWQLCDGTNGTPDLRNRFVVGSGATYSTGNTGGTNSVALTESQIPSHNHTLTASSSSAGPHSHAYLDKHTGTDSAGSGTNNVGSNTDFIDVTRTTSNVGAHTHAISGTIASTGGDGSHENRPPYYAVAFIMRIP